MNVALEVYNITKYKGSRFLSISDEERCKTYIKKRESNIFFLLVLDFCHRKKGYSGLDGCF